MNSTSSKKKMAFILKGYPRVSETFIAQEIYLLEQKGFDIEIFSMRKAREPERQPIVALIKAPVTYIPEYIFEAKAEFLRSTLSILVKKPVGFAKGLLHSAAASIAGREYSPFKRFLQAAWLINKKQNDFNDINHLHSHFIHSPTELAFYISKITNIPYSISAHAKDIYTITDKQVVERVNASQLIMTCTNFNYEYLKNLNGINTKKVNKVYHGVDTSIFTPSTALAIDPSNPEIRLTSVGRLVPKKGYTYIFEALRMLKENGVHYRYDLFGEGEMKKELLQKSKELGLENHIHFHFTATHPEIIKSFLKKGIFLCGSQIMDDGDKDGIPNTVAEAMSMELPVIVTDVSGIPELVNEDGVNGVIVETKSAKALYDGIMKLINNPVLADEIGKAGRVRVKEFFDCHICIGDCHNLLSPLRNR